MALKVRTNIIYGKMNTKIILEFLILSFECKKRENIVFCFYPKNVFFRNRI